MTLRHLEIFMAVCRSMSMTQAAKDLNMTQPAVSKAVSELEAFYNVTLFDRLNRRIYLTEAGEALRQYAGDVITRFNESVSVLRDRTAFQTCRLCVNVTVAESILPQLVKQISQKLPLLDLQIGIHNSSAIESMLRNNECDIGIIDHRNDQLFDSVFLYEEALGLFASRQYCSKTEMEQEELLNYRLLLRESGSGNRNATESLLQTISYPSSQIWESSSDQALISLAENHMGITILPHSCVRNLRTLHEIHLENAQLKRRFHLVSLRNKYLNLQIRSCMDIIHDFCKDK